MRIRDRAGFTLVELLVTLGLFSVLVGSIVSVVMSVQRGYVRQRETTRAEDALRAGETAILAILRSAGANPHAMTGASAPRLEPNPLGHASFDNLRVVADFNPNPDGDTGDPLEDVQVWVASDTLFASWQTGGAATPVAYPVRSLLFEYFQSNGTPATTVAQVATATKVRVTLQAVRHTRPETVTRRERWVYLRNR